MEFGTGALKITPAHDPNDFIIREKYGLETLPVIDHTGKMNDHAEDAQGLTALKRERKLLKS